MRFSMRGLWRSLAVVVACGLVPVGAARADLADTIDNIKPSIVAVGVFKPTGSPAFTLRGTGFAVGDGNTVATNAHVVAMAQDGESLMVQARSGASGSELRRVRTLAVDKDHDLALLRVDGAPLPRMALKGGEGVREGRAVAFTGFPIGSVLGFVPVTHRGTVSAITPIALPSSNAQQLNPTVIRRLKDGVFRIYQLDATAYPGNSGSPVFDPDTGEVVGIINMVLVKGTKESALTHPSGIVYAIPASFLQDLLQGNR